MSALSCAGPVAADAAGSSQCRLLVRVCRYGDRWLLWIADPRSKGARVTARFNPQPYPLYAIPLNKADDPARFELTLDPIRLVLGWVTDDDGEVLPVLAGGAPAGTPWNGPVFYEETRERAEQTAKNIDKADRSSIRDARMVALFDRWESWGARVEKRLDRIGPS